MPNPNPKRSPFQFRRSNDLPKEVKLSRKAITVKLPIVLDERLREMEDRTVWLRSAIIDRAIEDGVITEDEL